MNILKLVLSMCSILLVSQTASAGNYLCESATALNVEERIEFFTEGLKKRGIEVETMELQDAHSLKAKWKKTILPEYTGEYTLPEHIIIKTKQGDRLTCNGFFTSASCKLVVQIPYCMKYIEMGIITPVAQ